MARVTSLDEDSTAHTFAQVSSTSYLAHIAFTKEHHESNIKYWNLTEHPLAQLRSSQYASPFQGFVCLNSTINWVTSSSWCEVWNQRQKARRHDQKIRKSPQIQLEWEPFKLKMCRNSICLQWDALHTFLALLLYTYKNNTSSVHSCNNEALGQKLSKNIQNSITVIRAIIVIEKHMNDKISNKKRASHEFEIRQLVKLSKTSLKIHNRRTVL